jgi:hypothetical protein
VGAADRVIATPVEVSKSSGCFNFTTNSGAGSLEGMIHLK